MAQLELEPRSLGLESSHSNPLSPGTAYCPWGQRSPVLSPRRSLKVIAPTIVSVPAVFISFLNTSLSLASCIHHSTKVACLEFNSHLFIAKFGNPFSLNFPWTRPYVTQPIIQSLKLPLLHFCLACYLCLMLLWLWVNHVLFNIFITSSFLCNHVSEVYEKNAGGPETFLEWNEFGGAIETVTWKSWSLLAPSLLCSHFVHIFITEFTVLYSNYVHLSL